MQKLIAQFEAHQPEWKRAQRFALPPAAKGTVVPFTANAGSGPTPRPHLITRLIDLKAEPVSEATPAPETSPAGDAAGDESEPEPAPAAAGSWSLEAVDAGEIVYDDDDMPENVTVEDLLKGTAEAKVDAKKALKVIETRDFDNVEVEALFDDWTAALDAVQGLVHALAPPPGPAPEEQPAADSARRWCRNQQHQ